MSLITPDFGLFFWMAIVFFIVLAILWKWGFPTIVNMVNSRKEFIDDSLRKAHEANERLANIQKEGETMLQNARDKQAQILKDAAETRDEIVVKAQEKATNEGSRLLNEAKAEIEVEKQNAIRDIRTQVAEISVQVAEKIVREKLSSDESQMELINKLLNDISVGKQNE